MPCSFLHNLVRSVLQFGVCGVVKAGEEEDTYKITTVFVEHSHAFPRSAKYVLRPIFCSGVTSFL